MSAETSPDHLPNGKFKPGNKAGRACRGTPKGARPVTFAKAVKKTLREEAPDIGGELQSEGEIDGPPEESHGRSGVGGIQLGLSSRLHSRIHRTKSCGQVSPHHFCKECISRR